LTELLQVTAATPYCIFVEILALSFFALNFFHKFITVSDFCHFYYSLLERGFSHLVNVAASEISEEGSCTTLLIILLYACAAEQL